MMYPNQQPPMQGMANQMAQHGRYGDSMLVHMNPIEVQGLASLSPTGSLTVNPVTGQPEAFLPFLAPLLGSLAGSAFLPTVIPALAGNAALAGAIGSGLATTAATGDLKQGILSGLTGYGLGSALQAAADTLNPADSWGGAGSCRRWRAGSNSSIRSCSVSSCTISRTKRPAVHNRWKRWSFSSRPRRYTVKYCTATSKLDWASGSTDRTAKSN
jgi:hypothetical protein